ncbi:hypothetical protein ABIE28_000963 [Devosia sp. 2618]
MVQLDLFPLPIGERVDRPLAETGEGDTLSVRLTASPHPALRATFSPMGRRIEAEVHHGRA